MAGLTDTAIRKAKPAAKGYKLTDDGGLHVFVSPAGGKSWRYRYEFGGKEKLLTLGQYPVMGLADARAARDEARKLVRDGRDPALAKRQQQIVAAVQSGETFEVLGRDWHTVNLPRWSAIHGADILESLERDVFPVIGMLPIREVSVPLVLAVVRAVEARGSMETARRIRQRMEAVFDFAIAAGKGVDNPARTVTGAMAPMQRGRHPAITDLAGAREILQRVEAQPGHPLTKLAHRLLALTAVRPGIVINLPWDELPRGETIWTVPAARMKLSTAEKLKGERDHLVPLPKQALEVIAAARKLSGNGPLAFPNYRNAHRPMTEGAIRTLLNKAGYQDRHVGHGWRATFSSIMNELYPADRHIIELMLAHKLKDETEAAYNRALHLKRRIELATIWANLISEGLQPAKNLLPAR